MKDYLTFKEELHKSLPDYLPQTYRNWSPQINRIPKVNGFAEAITLRPPEGKGVSPNLYIADAYEHYSCEKDMEAALKAAADFLVRGIESAEKVQCGFDIAQREGKIIFSLVGREKNKELLELCPHRNLLDMAIVYRLLSAGEAERMYSALITKGAAENLGLSEEELYQRACKTTPEEFPLKIKEIAPGFYLMTNEVMVLGAGSILYDGALERLSKKIGGDIFLIPSSIHEFFAVPAEKTDAEGLRHAIYEINRKVVESAVVLSDSLYFYSASRKKLGFAADFFGRDGKGAGQIS